MSAISSFISAANVYPATDRNSLAQTTGAVAGTKQALAETDQETPHGGHDEGQNAESEVPAAKSDDATASSPANRNRYVLNVTA